MPSLVRGRVVYPTTAIPDPQGQNPKSGRPFVVISKNEDIKQGHRIQAVGITSELQSSPADHYVRLPHGPNAKTGLRRESAALCTWLIEISADSLELERATFIPTWLVRSLSRSCN